MTTSTTTLTRPNRLAFNVYGTPAPQGSKKHVGGGRMIESNAAALNTWREDVKLAALRAVEAHTGWDSDYLGVALHVTFTLPRPAGHYRTKAGERTHLLHDWAPVWHTKKPDLDKLLRSTCDALTTAGVYVDDSRVAQVFCHKTYPASPGNPSALERPGARIVLTGLAHA